MTLYFCSKCTTGGNFFVGLKYFDANIAIISDFVLIAKNSFIEVIIEFMEPYLNIFTKT